MPRRDISVEALRHKDKRRNIPTAELEPVMDEKDETPIRLAYERRNRDLDPQLVWRGKDEQDWSDLIVQAPPLYIQEKVHPKVLIDDLLRQSKARRDEASPPMPDLFADFNGLPDKEALTEFYQHDANWSNRMILGDSLSVMASLAEREGLRGKVQCIYIDPPYGINFRSNFQWSTTSPKVTDRKEHITREPEQVKAFRDTWRDGIHSYLTYLRDRLTVARDLLAVHPVTGIGYDLCTAAFGQPNIAPPALIETLLRQAAAEVEGHRFSPRFLIGEWREVVDAWQLASWEAYRDVARLGRKTRIGGKQREVLWSIFDRVRAGLGERKAVTWPDLFGRVTAHMAANRSPFDFVVVDEAQDVGVAELRFLASLAANRPDGLFFAGDLGQRIFQQPFSWRSLGVDVRGRSYALRINYRTSHQIRAQADRLLPTALADVDGNAEDRRGTVSVFNGRPPTVETFDDPEQEVEGIGKWLAARIGEGVEPHEIGVFVRSTRELRRARNAVKQAGVQAIELTDKIEVAPGKVSIGTMHLAKGLEFRAVAVMACDDEVIPLQERIENVADEADLEDVYNTERHLLYVACTRARDHLLVTGVSPTSEFLEDLKGWSERGLNGPAGA